MWVCVINRIAFIEYATEAEAAAAVETYNESDLDGRTLNVNFAGAKPESQADAPDRRKYLDSNFCYHNASCLGHDVSSYPWLNMTVETTHS